MLNITPLTALKDNYIWLIQQGSQAIVVDPGEATPVFTFLAKNLLNLTACLLTHNHHDHTDGVAELQASYPDLPIYGPAEVGLWANRIVKGGDQFEINGLMFEVLNSPGHTAQHISFLLNREHLFCGDALFSAGCGRVFTQDYAAQFATLQQFKSLPDFVQIYAGHEYTLSNLKFAESELPPSCFLAEYQEQIAIWRTQNRPSLPSTLAIEKQINPFLQAVDLDTFIAMRLRKDNNT